MSGLYINRIIIGSATQRFLERLGLGPTRAVFVEIVRLAGPLRTAEADVRAVLGVARAVVIEMVFR